MRIHLFSTDCSGLALVDRLGNDERIVAIVAPENRKATAKVRELINATDLPVVIQPRGGKIPTDLPQADIGVSWLYSQLIDPSDLAKYRLGVLNMHGGKLPDYRGASVLQWAIVNGEHELGITWHQLEAEVDTGSIWAEKAIPIPPDADAAQMRVAMIEAGAQLFPDAWRRLTSGDAPIRTITSDSGKVWPQRRPNDGKIGVNWPETKLRNLIRALPAPWPRPILDVGGLEYCVLGIADANGPLTVKYTTAEGRMLYLLVAAVEAR